MNEIDPKHLFVVRYGYYPSEEQRDKTRLREVELILEALRCYKELNRVKC